MKVFVVMPYGGDDDTKKKHYNRVFRHLIKDAVEQVDRDSDVVRQDYSNQNGRIIGNIVQGLAESDLVVADISECNWNVAYELGMRHVMKDHGTIIICDDQTKLPYDVESLNIFTYSRDNWMDEEEELQKRLSMLIKECLKSAAVDSPVHEKYSALPGSLVEMLSNTNDDEQRAIMELKEVIKGLEKENNDLKVRIENAGLNTNEDTIRQTSIIDIFRPALETENYISDTAVKQLRKLGEEGNKAEFVEFLAKVLEEGFLDETDCRNIYIICKNYIKIPRIIEAYLERVIQFYPDSEELQAFLANSYIEDYQNRDKARALMNKTIGLVQKANTYELTKKHISERTLASFFNVYIGLQLYNELITISKLLLEKYPVHSSIIRRNMISAYIKLDEAASAIETAEILISQDEKDDRNHYSHFRSLCASGRYAEAYEALEQCINKDERDTDYLFTMAGLIIDEMVARRSVDGEVERIPHQDVGAYAAPFAIYAVNVERSNDMLQRIVDFLHRNKLDNYIEVLEDYVKTGQCQIDFSMVEYCYEL